MVKAFWEKLLALFGKAGVQGQFFLFHKITQTRIHPCQATEDISSIIQLFDQLTQSGLNLPNSFHAMLILTQLSNDLFGLPGSAQPYEQKKYKGPKWSHKPGKQQKRE